MSSTIRPSRREVTEKIINLLDQRDRINVDDALRAWYYNIRENGGYRLTPAGFQILCMANLSSWHVDLKNKDITKTSLLALDRKLNWPYYIDPRNKKLILFSSREATMATLYGDVTRWINSIN